jgi:hypothetical protein
MGFMTNITKRTTGPMPNVGLIAKIRKLYDDAKKSGNKISFQKVADILNEELKRKKKLCRQQVCRYYYNDRVAF